MEEERVREEIRQLIQDIYDWPYQLGDGAFNEWADEILAIKGIRIEADDHSLPEINILGSGYQTAQQDMKQAGFVKVRPKKE